MSIRKYLKGLMLINENIGDYLVNTIRDDRDSYNILDIKDNIAFISVEGILTRDFVYPGFTTSMNDLIDVVRSVKDNDAVTSLVFKVNSPGGTAEVIDLLGKEIAECGKKTTSVVTGIAHSGAYWLVSQTDEVIVSPLASVGSIGVVYYCHNDDDNMIKITSDNAPMKAIIGKTEDEVNEIKSRLNTVESEFIAAVAKGRGVNESEVIKNYGKGGIKLGREAVDIGMADKLVETQDELNKELTISMSENTNTGVKSDEQLVAEINELTVKIQESDKKINELTAEIKRINAISNIKAVGNESLILEGISDTTMTNTEVMQRIIENGKFSMEPLVHGSDAVEESEKGMTGAEAVWSKKPEIRDEFSSKESFTAYYERNKEEFE